ncbi:Cyclin-T2 [Araneus ventricosus]|uniref:Cyclin-T2 n=1 Tax=Araneus ventricosus TaxID=182803 RepID=A0A4Y2KQS3_ARAVE|nr:Cyclin-T2 [Araneus ventricosus]
MMQMENRWLFSKEKIRDSPNMKLLQDPNKEFIIRLGTTTFIQLIGQKLHLSQHSISAAAVYFHRFYMFFSLEDVDAKKLAMVAVFLACKSQNDFRKLEHVIKVAHVCMDLRFPAIDVQSEFYMNLKDELLFLENVLLSVLGFEVDVELPHPYIVKICQLIRGSQELTKISYLLTTASIMVSTLCLQYKPRTVACVCVNLGARWSLVQIEPVSEERPWFYYVDPSLSTEGLNDLTDELGKAVLKGTLTMKSPVLNCVVSDTVVMTPFRTTKAGVTENSENDEKLSLVPAVTFRKRVRCDDSADEIKVKIPRNYVILR